jgi:hypothetical protein
LFVGLSAFFGLNLEYRFEVTVISIVWLTLSVVGALLCAVFGRSVPESTAGRSAPASTDA